MDVFISSSHIDKRWADKLTKAIEKHGLSTWVDSYNLQPGASWQDEIETELNSARAIVLLVGPRQPSEQMQHMVWRAALEESWSDSYKPLIPLLIRNAELPQFLSPWKSKALRLGRSQKDLDEIVNVLIEAANSYTPLPDGSERRETPEEGDPPPPPYSSAAGDPPPPGDASAFEDRLSYIEEAAGSLSEDPGDPPSPSESQG
jgi:hypothetical protein